MIDPTCDDCVPAKCVDNGPATSLKVLKETNLDALVKEIDDHLAILEGLTKTSALVRRTMPEGSTAKLSTLLQTLIDGYTNSQQELALLKAKQTPDQLLNLGTGISTKAIGGSDSDTIKQALQALVNKVQGLQADVNQLKAGQPAASNLYVPHY